MYRNGYRTGIFAELEFPMTRFMTLVPTIPSLHQSALYACENALLEKPRLVAKAARVIERWNEAEWMPGTSCQPPKPVVYFADCSYFGSLLNLRVKIWCSLSPEARQRGATILAEAGLDERTVDSLFITRQCKQVRLIQSIFSKLMTTHKYPCYIICKSRSEVFQPEFPTSHTSSETKLK